MKPKYRQSLDGNHLEILRYLRSHGIEVTDFAAAGKVPDLLVFKGTAKWIELKIPGRRAAFTYDQLNYIANTYMPVAFATTAQEALEFARTGVNGLSQKQKDSIAGMLHRDGDKNYTVAQVERALNT